MRSYQTSQEYVELMRRTGMVPASSMLPDAQAAFLKAELDRWGAAIKASWAKFE